MHNGLCLNSMSRGLDFFATNDLLLNIMNFEFDFFTIHDELWISLRYDQALLEYYKFWA